MKASKKSQIIALLKSIETGDPAAVSVVNEARYIQHNPQTHEGSEGLAILFKRLSQTSPRVNIVRAFEDGDFVFAHTEYDFEQRNIGFEVFRFEEGQAVEHWDNIQRRLAPNLSNHSMVDGSSKATIDAPTEKNRELIRTFVTTVLIDHQLKKLDTYIEPGSYVEHSPLLSDDVLTLQAALQIEHEATRKKRIDYQKIHRILAEGDFVLSVCEGALEGDQAAFYDLFRVSDGKIREHWDTTEKVAPKSEWRNDNGKF